MVWKQPIPTNLDEIFGEDNLARLIYVELLLHATNEKRIINLNGQIVELERGQVYFTILHLSKLFNSSRDRIRHALHRLSTPNYQKIDIRITPKGCIGTIQNYDEVIRIDNRPTTDRQQTDINKSVESVENKYVLRKKISIPVLLQGSNSSKKGLFPCTPLEIWEIAMYLQIPKEVVDRKHKRIMRQVDTGEFQIRYPKNKTTYNTLLDWLEHDVDRGTVTQVDEMGLELLKIQKPNGIQG